MDVLNSVRNKSTHLNYVQKVVGNGYCVGCGLCVAVCPENSFRMEWTQYGFLEPVNIKDTCSGCLVCVQVCPFADGLVQEINNPDEDELGEIIFGKSSSKMNNQIGYYHDCFVGYATSFRQDSTSGGISTWVLTFLLATGEVDKVICVHPSDSKIGLFEYRVCTTMEEVRLGAKSRYYPVHLADVLKEVMDDDARYAIVATPCVVKGIRLAQMQNKEVREKIVFCIGLFCGGLKSAFFTEYLAAHIGISKDNIINPQYRIKHEGPSSQGYYFGCDNPSNNDEILEFRVKKLRDLWGPGFFKSNACDYCDDITSELADLSTGDAWISPYTSDWRGTNIIITRSNMANEVIEEGIKKGFICLEKISPEKVVRSQISNFKHRREGLPYRLYWALNTPVPRKRVQPRPPRNPIISNLHRYRMLVRAKSHEAWLLQRDSNGTRVFDNYIRRDLFTLRVWQYINSVMHKIIKRLDSKS